MENKQTPKTINQPKKQQMHRCPGGNLMKVRILIKKILMLKPKYEFTTESQKNEDVFWA